MIKKIVVLSAVLLYMQCIQAIRAEMLICEMSKNQVVISTTSPKFGWVLVSDANGDRQTSYQILIASSITLLESDKGDVWSSGKVKSDQSQLVEFQGGELKSGHRYYWKVRVWDAKGKKSEWSKVYHFDMGLLQPADWKAQWIGAIKYEDTRLPEGHQHHKWALTKQQKAAWDSVAPLARRSIQLRKEFNVSKQIKVAKVYVSGLGHYELTLNGTKVGDNEFAPLWSDYDKTIYYNVYDLTTALKSGANAFGVLLGNGMFNVTGNRYIKFWGSYGPPTMILQLEIEYNDGTKEQIISDKSWKYSVSPITFNCIFGGEDYDATLEQSGWDMAGFNDLSWNPVVLQGERQARLLCQTAPPVKIMKKYPVKKLMYSQKGFYLFDMGQNLAGYPSIKVTGKKGQVVKIIVGELVRGDTAVTQNQSGGPHTYQYTLKGDGIEVWHPRFSYYGYQYVQIEGVQYKDDKLSDELPELLDLESCFVYSSANETGHFECSSDLYTRVDWLINNSIKSNMQSVMTDCPHREKLGWLEETHLVAPGILYAFDVSTFLPKVQQDMADAQTADGLVPNIAPEYVNFGDAFRDSPEWGSSSIVNPWIYYEFFGDKSLIINHYPAMKRYFEYLIVKSDSGILSHGLGDWYDYGAKRSGFTQNTPIALTATAYFYYDAVLMAKSAQLAGYADDALFFSAWAVKIKESFNRQFYHPSTAQYATGSQVSNAMALYMGLVAPENKQAVLHNLVKDIRDRGNRLTSGDIGNKYLFQALCENGRSDVMFDMTHHYDVPGYGFQLQFGVTTLTENWDPRQGASWNHFMMGQIKEWFYRGLAGINPDLDNPGFKHIVLKPSVVGDIKWVKATHKSFYGNIVSDWEIVDGWFMYSIEVPVNTSATAFLPNVDVSTLMINDKPLSEKIKKYAVLNQDKKIDLKSGRYIIKAKLN